MRPENLFITENGVLKFGYYGLVTQAENYSKKKMECDENHSFAPEVLEGEYDMKSDVWSFGKLLIDTMESATNDESDSTVFCDAIKCSILLASGIDPEEFIDFLMKCVTKDVRARWSVNELMNVSNCDGE